MPGASATSLSTLIRPAVENEPTIIKYTNREFFETLRQAGMDDKVAVGDTAFRWKINRSTGNSSGEVFAEGQGAPQVGAQTWTEAALTWVYHRIFVQRSGHARDAMKSHYLGEDWAGDAQMSGEYRGALDDLADLMANTFLGSTNNGIQIAVDSAGTYAGLARASITDWASYEEAGGAGALTVAMLDNTWEAVRDNDRGGKVEALLMPWNQITNFANLAGIGAPTSLVRITTQGEAPKLGLGFNESGLSFHNARVYGIADLTDTEILMLSGLSSGVWKFVTIRPIERKDLAITDDTADNAQVSTGGTLVCLDSRRQGKITNVAA